MRLPIGRLLLIAWALASVVFMLVFSSVAGAAGVAAVSPAKGELDVVLRHDGDGSGTDPNAESLVLLQRLDGVWQAPINLGGSVHQDSEVGLTSSGTGKLTVAVRWTDNTLRTRDWTSSTGWGAWSASIATGLTGGPALSSFAGGNVLVTWRGTSGGYATYKVRPPGGSWPAYGTALSAAVAAGTGPSTRPFGINSVAIDFVPSFSSRPMETAWTDQSEPIYEVYGWNGSSGGQQSDFLTVPSLPTKRTLSVGAGIFAAAGTSRSIVQLVEGAPGTTGSSIDMGGTVAGSTSTSRPGESIIPNTPGSVQAYENATSTTQRYELFWREDNGCIATRTSATLTPLASWGSATEPVAPVSGRCVWPGLPTISALSPANGSAAGGTEVTITGTNLDSIDTVKFGTTPATKILSQTATKLIVVSPAQAAGVVNLSVSKSTTVTSVNTSADDYTYAAVASGNLRFAPQYRTAATILKNASVTGPNADLNQWSEEHEATDLSSTTTPPAKHKDRVQVVTGGAVPPGANAPWGALKLTNALGDTTDVNDGDPKPRAEAFTDRDSPNKRWKAGDTAWVDFWINIPDLSRFTRTGSNAGAYWSLIFQWKGGSGSPPVALEINPVNGNLKVRSNPFNVDQQLGQIIEGKWQRVTLGVYFSTSAGGSNSGTIDATFDGNTISQIQAQTIGSTTNTTVYPKEGLYQTGLWTNELDRTMFHSAIRIADTKALAQQR